MSLSSLSDESVLRYYANMRSMVALGIGIDRHAVLGEQARKRAITLEDELTRRGIDFEPIAWPE